MSTITAAGSGTSAPNGNAPLRGLELEHFLTLMITELQNQDPLNPLDNAQILQQISQIREIEATQQLRDTLDAVLLGQNLSNASGLLNKHVTGLTEKGEQVDGAVDRVSVEDNEVQLHVGDKTLPLTNVKEILPTAGEP